MKLPLQIAKKIQQLLLPNESITSSSMKHAIVEKMLQDGVLQKQQTSNTKALYFIKQKENIKAYLHNHFGIIDLAEYIIKIEEGDLDRVQAIAISGDSKLKTIRTFKGFLVNCYLPIKALLNGKEITILPTEGSFTFISEYEQFNIPKNVTIVGIENAESFRQIQKQQYLFTDFLPLFVCRYPQSNDLIKWLQATPNKYLHFGDLDFAGIDIYLNTFKKHLGKRASFFIPKNTETMLQKFGNKNLFDKQYSSNKNYDDVDEDSIIELVNVFYKYKKVLEQEIFIERKLNLF